LCRPEAVTHGWARRARDPWKSPEGEPKGPTRNSRSILDRDPELDPERDHDPDSQSSCPLRRGGERSIRQVWAFYAALLISANESSAARIFRLARISS
jgi:hypothetical protein